MNKYALGTLAGAFLVTFGLHTNILRSIAVLIGIVLLIECWGRA